MNNKQSATILSILVFSLAMLSGNAFAAPGGLPGEAAARTAADANLQSQINTLQEQIDNIPTTQTFEIGDLHAGGIVFYVTEDGKHGLIAAFRDAHPSVPWSFGDPRNTDARGDGIGAGSMNTAIIVAAQSDDPGRGENVARLSAASVAADYAVFEDGLAQCFESSTATCLGDWYLPSKDELSLMYTNLYQVGLGGFANDRYWSSTEKTTTAAWNQGFTPNGQQSTLNKMNHMHTRAVRAFLTIYLFNYLIFTA